MLDLHALRGSDELSHSLFPQEPGNHQESRSSGSLARKRTRRESVDIDSRPGNHSGNRAADDAPSDKEIPVVAILKKNDVSPRESDAVEDRDDRPHQRP